MRLSPPLEPMLARSVSALPTGGRQAVFEQKTDGFRVVVFARPMPFLQSRRGAALAGAFPELARAAAGLGVEAVLDAELVVSGDGRLDFAALQQRSRRRGASAERAAAQQPAHLVVFDLLEIEGAVLLQEPLHRRRAALEELFAIHRLSAPWTLCPQTTDAEVARTWLDSAWGAVGVEGIMIKDPASRYRPGVRGWDKLRARTTTEAVIGAVTGTLRFPTSLLLGRFDAGGRLRMIGRTSPLHRAASSELGGVLRPAGRNHPWHGRRFSAGWHTSDPLVFQPVVPEFVAEIVADTAVDAGRYRHPVRYLRLRDDMTAQDIRR
ncbi:ATP-dependent DNA ligase [Streptomyces sp. NBC_01433]|uniref:ATP-dependent DNA ligase n=1 Tax=Streptomyces sp. NBC_01433 TaxID=2903864 RepID=UPI00225ABCBA|nr:ATP-dependent DNA ligase [Streptomyces sp. NBC_01433]MCX4681328.1 ATP-dependent DNA ligase [Streptomyces sp. NBC_01433]MCX4681733.1 ATP-dependent DNA ligase [Streptomyces sp. NBC_01433]MCX4682404.1 ATP-dependent DNA ligase [Streptomyces sp. NBC_01433]